MAGASSDAAERPLNRVVLHLSPPFADLLGAATAYEDELLTTLTQKGLIAAVSRENRTPAEGASHDASTAAPSQDAAPARAARDLWKREVMRVTSEAEAHAFDPWWDRNLHELRSEVCVRYDYDAETREWHESETLCKMEDEAFGEGAMRRCYRVKKLSQSVRSAFVKLDWRHCPNYVAKEYKDEDIRSRRDVVFDDVRMQMTAKHWGMQFNAKHPPKQVDFIQCFVLELPQRPGSPVFCCERLIAGDYIKYNNNSGFVDDEHLRSTPQAFSHFTFHESEGREMVVDVQGVGDLYTDPQFHTHDGEEYGEGNLGPRGMASFLSTHHCDDLCRLLGLPPFVLSPKRQHDMRAGHSEIVRRVQEMEEKRNGVGPGSESGWASSVRDTAGSGDTMSTRSSLNSTPAETAIKARDPTPGNSTLSRGAKQGVNPLLASLFRQMTTTALSVLGRGGFDSDAPAARGDIPAAPLASLPRWVLALGDGSDEAAAVWELDNAKIGAVHLSMARLDLEDDVPAVESAVFHLAEAARNGDDRSLRGLYDMLRGLPQSAVPGLKLEEEGEARVVAEVRARLAESGDCAAMMDAADAAAAEGDTLRAVDWLERVEAIRTEREKATAAAESGSHADDIEDDHGGYVGYADDDGGIPDRLDVLQKLAAAVRPQDPERAGDLFSEAAELATGRGKGKLAMKLNMLAEEAWGEMEEEEEA